jgi:uncharacterized protein GlcG (DUF336 family)
VRRSLQRAFAFVLCLLLAACGGGGDGGTGFGGCSGDCQTDMAQALSVAEVESVIAQAVQEAQARGARATIAVVDRVGNVLAVFRMTGAAATFNISGNRGVTGGLEGVNVLPAELAAIAKAVTGAYLSSEGNAFSTRTASQIVQENFNPGEVGSPGGPLFGVQFSQLSCSDLVRRATDGSIGPKRSPLGLAADPGGFPLYKSGTVVGGIGVIADATYALDINIGDTDSDSDELIALAGTRGFDAPPDRRADRITADGRTLRYADSETLASIPSAAPSFASINGVQGSLVAVAGYAGAAITAGVAFGTAASGFRADTHPSFAGLNAFTLVDAGNVPRYPPIAGTDGFMTAAEVGTLLAEALRVANRARAQIRRPLGAAAQVTVAVVDTNGAIVGLVRTADAPVFGTDVAVQKARTALFFSHPNAAAELAALPAAAYLAPNPPSPITAYLAQLRSFLANPAALADGIAYSTRAVGNFARPFYPDGINANGPGPLSKPFAAWSPFSDGLQLDLSFNVLVATALGAPTVGCTGLARTMNGIQIFPGGVPIYRGNQLVGAIGVSGDGVDQDDMVALLGLANAGAALGTGIANAPAGIRADTLVPPGTGAAPRYVQCPLAPFNDSTATNVCAGI